MLLFSGQFAYLFAQGYDCSEQNLEFIYIAHDRTTPVNKICEILDERYKDAFYYADNALIIYLASQDDPIIVTVNVGKDNRKDYDLIVNALQSQLEHDIDPASDVDNIVDIFNSDDFLNPDGTPRYKSFRMTYFVTPLFWTMGYNADIIAALHFILDLESLDTSYFMSDVYYPDNGSFCYDESHPFGETYEFANINVLPIL